MNLGLPLKDLRFSTTLTDEEPKEVTP